MTDLTLVIPAIGILVFLAHFFAWLFSYTAIPDGLLLIVVGLVLGFWVSPTFFGEIGSVALTIALVLMLFNAGTKLRLDTLKQTWSTALKLVITSFALTMIGIGTMLWFFTPLNLMTAFMVGAIVGGTSSAIIIPLLERLNVLPDTKTLLILESTISDVLVIVVTLGMITALQTQSIAISAMAGRILLMFTYAIVAGIITGFVWSLLLDNVRHVNNSMFVTLAFVFILYGVSERLGASGPITALVFGITLGNIGLLKTKLNSSNWLVRLLIRPYTLSRRERSFFSELVFLLQTFFFVYVGISIQLSFGVPLALALSSALFLIILRLIATRVSIPHGINIREAALISVTTPRGLAAAVLAVLLVQNNSSSGVFIQEFVYGVILWSITLTALFVFLLEKTPFSNIYNRLLVGYSTNAIPGTEPTSRPV